jgi:hypothetical protein
MTTATLRQPSKPSNKATDLAEVVKASGGDPEPGCFTLHTTACMQTVDDNWAEFAGRHIRAKPAYPFAIAATGTAGCRMTVAMAKTVKYAG